MGLLGDYADRRMARIFLIGVISGFPWVLIGAALSLWLKDNGLDRSTIGFASLIFGVYAVNFLWAPLIDRIAIPYLGRRIGSRKAWILLCQLLLILLLFCWAVIDPAEEGGFGLAVAVGLGIAITSATQDIAIDALRIEQIPPDDGKAMAAGAAVSVMGWWTGFKIGGLLVLFPADIFRAMGYGGYWNLTFAATVIPVSITAALLLAIPESVRGEGGRAKPAGGLPAIKAGLDDMVIAPISSFFAANGIKIALAILGFIFLFKIGEAFLGRMSIIFYSELGFSKTDIGIFSKGLGWVTTIAFTLIGGWFSMRAGTIRALFIAGIAMAATNILFSVLAWVGKSKALFAAVVILDDLAAAFATVAFVAFISRLVNRRYTATQYALLASLGTAGRTLIAGFSGVVVDALGGDWGIFFILTALMVTPSLLLLLYLAPHIRFGQSGKG